MEGEGKNRGEYKRNANLRSNWLPHLVSSDFEIRLEVTQANEKKWQAHYIVSHPIKQQVQWRRRTTITQTRVCTPARANKSALLVLSCVCVSASSCRVCASLWCARVSGGAGRHQGNGAKLAQTNHQSRVSQAAALLPKKQRRGLIEQPEWKVRNRRRKNDAGFTPANWTSYSTRMLLWNEVGDVTFYSQFTLTLAVSICCYTFGPMLVLFWVFFFLSSPGLTLLKIKGHLTLALNWLHGFCCLHRKVSGISYCAGVQHQKPPSHRRPKKRKKKKTVKKRRRTTVMFAAGKVFAAAKTRLCAELVCMQNNKLN